jgi:phosphoribosyl-ATP pyrophosphohydrolase
MTDSLSDLEEVLRSRRDDRSEGSYSAGLFADSELLQRKIMEEAFEMCLELGRPSPIPERVSEEAADLLFHLLVGLVSAEVPIADVERVLKERKR